MKKKKNKQNKILSFLLNHLFLPIQSDVLVLAPWVHQLWGLPHTASLSEVTESIWRVSAELYGLPKEAVSFGWYQDTCVFMDRSRYLFLAPSNSLVLTGYQRILLRWSPLYPKSFSSNNNNKHNTVKESEKNKPKNWGFGVSLLPPGEQQGFELWFVFLRKGPTSFLSPIIHINFSSAFSKPNTTKS